MSQRKPSAYFHDNEIDKTRPIIPSAGLKVNLQRTKNVKVKESYSDLILEEDLYNASSLIENLKRKGCNNEQIHNSLILSGFSEAEASDLGYPKNDLTPKEVSTRGTKEQMQAIREAKKEVKEREKQNERDKKEFSKSLRTIKNVDFSKLEDYVYPIQEATEKLPPNSEWFEVTDAGDEDGETKLRNKMYKMSDKFFFLDFSANSDSYTICAVPKGTTIRGRPDWIKRIKPEDI